MKTIIHVIFHSMYGHIYQLAEGIAEGARQTADTQVTLFQIPELMSDSILHASGAKTAKQAFEHIPTVNFEQLPYADAYIFGSSIRFDNTSMQMRYFLEKLSSLWNKHFFISKVASVFTNPLLDNQKAALLTHLYTPLLQLGMTIADIPRSLTTKPSPVNSNFLAGYDVKRLPTENELALARRQGKHVANIARQFKLGEMRCSDNLLQHPSSLSATAS